MNTGNDAANTKTPAVQQSKYSPDVKRRFLIQEGFDPALYYVDDDGNIFKNTEYPPDVQRAFLIKKGFDPDKYEVSGIGIFPKTPLNKPPQNQNTVDYSKIPGAKYLVIYQVNGEQEFIVTDNKPKPFGNGFTVKDLIRKSEAVISSPYQIIELGKK